MKEKGSRRMFMNKVTLAGAAVAATGVAASTVSGAERSDGSSNRRRKATKARPGAPFSRAVEYNGVVFVAGVVGRATGEQGVGSSSFEAECRQALTNLKDSVEAAGSSMGSVLKCNCFLTDVDDFATFNRVYSGFFPADPPARSTVIVKALVVPGARLEIDCTTCVE